MNKAEKIMQLIAAWLFLVLSLSTNVLSQECFDMLDVSDGSGDGMSVKVSGLTNKTANEGDDVTFTCQTNIGVVWWLLRCQRFNNKSNVIINNNSLRLISVSQEEHKLMITCVVNMSDLIKHEESVYLFVNSIDENGSGGISTHLIYIVIGVGGFLAVVLAVILIILLCLICVLRNRRERPMSPLILRKQSTSSRMDRASSSFIRRSFRKPKAADPIEDFRHTHTDMMESHPPLPTQAFSSHLAVMRMNDNQRFMLEFGTIPMEPEYPKETAMLECNKVKNRYEDILPYDHSRVKLSTVKWQEGSDYINASYLDGYMKHKQYIGTQGPLPSTIGDFWRMIWEENSRTIVMVTNLQEKNAVKCEAYWPPRVNEPMSYGGIDVILVEVVPLADYTIRTFSIIKGGSQKDTREIRQFHFTSWPDRGVPEFPTAMLSMIRCVRAHHNKQHTSTGPMTVHCSAGVGRTGAFIVIDSMLQRILNGEISIDIYGHVTLLRNQRNCMVQTEDQYFFIHEAVAEAIACGVTEVMADSFPSYLDKLELIQEDGESSLLEVEFKRVATDRTEPHRFASATRNVNKTKNRFVNIMPYEYNRVKLSFIRATEGSDFINASYIDSYRQQRAFLATQCPLQNTVNDFWRMIWEHQSPIIVMLTRLEEKQQECSAVHWSDRERRRFGDILVQVTIQKEMGEYIYREMTLSHAENPDKSHLVRHFQFMGWPERGVPESALPLLQLIQEVQLVYITLRTNKSVTVMCSSSTFRHAPVEFHASVDMNKSSGVGRTGVFITLHIILERFAIEGLIDVFQTIKMLRIQRSAMVQTLEQYHFCYEAVLDYLINTGQLPQMRSTSIERRTSVLHVKRPVSLNPQSLPQNAIAMDTIYPSRNGEASSTM